MPAAVLSLTDGGHMIERLFAQHKVSCGFQCVDSINLTSLFLKVTAWGRSGSEVLEYQLGTITMVAGSHPHY